jgi:hypothetical protein
VVNDGDIVSQEGIGIVVLNGNDIRNSGTITALGQAGIGISASDNNDAAIDEDGWSGVINFGTIEAGYVGIAVGNESVLRNRGEITAGGTGVAVGDDNIVSNEGSIEVGEGGTGLLAGAGNNIRNSGTIVSGGDGVVIGAGSSFENQGEGSSVVAVGDALRIEGESSGLIFNTGLLKGDVAIRGSSSGESITSVGVLNGAVLLGNGDDTLQLQYDAVVDGDIDGGAGTDHIRATSGVATINGRVTNVEQLTVTSIGLVFNAATGSQVGTTTVEDGALTLNGTLSTDMEVEIAGSLSGSTTINGHLQNAGTLEPGNVLGAVTIVGDYTQTATGRLAVELGSNAADVLNVTGAASLDGTLTTGLAGTDLAALEGMSYTVLSAGSIIGALDTNGIVQEGFWTIDVQQSGNAVTVTITDVDVTIGATAPVTDALANAVAAAAESGLAAFEGGQQLASLSYDSLADWESAAPTFVAGWSEMGARTPAGAMPKTGTGEFEGTTKGELTETGSPEALVVEGNVLLTADFASGLVNADFTGMEKIDSRGVTSAWVDFRARMSIADGTSEFAGTAGSEDGVWNGEAKGGFFGDEDGMPGHAAGLWSMSSALGRALGGFTAKRQ